MLLSRVLSGSGRSGRLHKFKSVRCQFYTSESVTESRQLNPLEQYDADCASKLIISDEYQRHQLAGLTTMHNELLNYRKQKLLPQPPKPTSMFARIFGGFHGKKSELGPRGTYMYGDVGCGKTMLMDMFYRTIPSHLTKRRVHFHAFIQSLHKEIHRSKSECSRKEDVIALATHHVSSEVDVLCLDEVAVIDVADAMILRHVWEAMYSAGMVTFMTSNRHPDELYLNGVQRESFLPAIELLKERNHVVLLDSPTDYRKLPRPSSGTYYYLSEGLHGDGGSTNEATGHAQHWFNHFSKGSKPTNDRNLVIWGRPVPIPKSAGDNVMQFTFDELCGTSRSAADYLEMCRNFESAVVTDIPCISLEQRDLIRRFITFLDAAYDSHINLAVTAARPFEQLFNTKHLRINPKTNKVELQGEEQGDNKVDLTSFAGHEEMFAFARALSRLKQMSSAEWLDYDRNS